MLPGNIKIDVAFQVKQLVLVSILKINQGFHIIRVFSFSLLLLYMFQVSILILAICFINGDLMTLDSSIVSQLHIVHILQVSNYKCFLSSLVCYFTNFKQKYSCGKT